MGKVRALAEWHYNTVRHSVINMIPWSSL